jgi:ParB/RepB/Spo0J family partition protein
MAKMGSGTGLREISLAQIIDTGNVRSDYTDIEELAESILKNGQLEPVLVKIIAEKDENGLDRFELVAGHRRRRAVQYLCEVKKESLTSLKAIIVTGDKLTLQLVENLQRSDLTAAERESGIHEMCKAGVPQKEVAARLSKPEGFVSRNVSAFKVREAAKGAGVDTSSLATATLNEIQAAAAADYAELVKQILQGGGTLDAARLVMENYRVAHGKPAKPRSANPFHEPNDVVYSKPEKGGDASEGGISDPLGIDPLSAADFTDELPEPEGEDVEVPPPAKPATKSESKKSPAHGERHSWLDDFDPPHKQVDFNNMCVSIMRYGKELEIEITNCKKFDWQNNNGNDEACVCDERCGNWYKHEAVKDIIALLHKGL